PSDRRVKVRGLQVHGAAQAAAGAGRRVAVNLGGADVSDIHRGDTLTAAGAFGVTRRFDAIVELLPDGKPLRHGARVRFHHGTAELLARVALATEYTGPAPAADDTEHADHQGKGAADDTEHADHQGKGAADDAEHTDHQGKGAADDAEHTDHQGKGAADD